MRFIQQGTVIQDVQQTSENCAPEADVRLHGGQSAIFVG